MFLVYYDEVKYHPPEQHAFWLGAIAIDSADVIEIEALVNKISEDAIGSVILDKNTEFHGKELCAGKGNFKGMHLDERLTFLSRLLEIISNEKIHLIYVKILPKNIVYTSDTPDEIAFMYLVEQVDGFLKTKKEIGMLFGDYDEPNIGSSVASLSNFRQGSTYWDRGRSIERIIDTVHFARSHHSRLIQLADIYVHCLQFVGRRSEAPWRKKIEETIRDSGILIPTRARIWPNEARWYR